MFHFLLTAIYPPLILHHGLGPQGWYQVIPAWLTGKSADIQSQEKFWQILATERRRKRESLSIS